MTNIATKVANHSCMFVDGWETIADNCYGTSGWWKPDEEQRKEYGD